MPPPLLTLQSRRVSAAPLLLSSAGRHPSPPLHTSPAGAPPLLRGSRVVGAVAGEEGRALRAIWWTKITTGGGGRGRRRRQSRRCRCWRRRPRTTWRAAPGARWTGGRRRTRASPTAASSTSGSSSSAPDDEGRDGRHRGRCVRAVGGVPQVQGHARRGRGGGVQGRADEAAAAHAERVLAGGQADGVRASQDVQGERQELPCRLRLRDHTHHAVLMEKRGNDGWIMEQGIFLPFRQNISILDSFDEGCSFLGEEKHVHMDRDFFDRKNGWEILADDPTELVSDFRTAPPSNRRRTVS